MTTKEFQEQLGTGDTCPGCGGEVVLVTADDGGRRAECPCSAVSVLVAA